ncbi:MAG: type I addiction module toxin, SymE family [Gammaproteobacteria bacterium]|nr:type I addiction module toxin, SymE family [Gammaproteobacteria bacterium]
MKPRRLTVNRTRVESRGTRHPRQLPQPIPLLRLQGRWLDQAGFTIGAEVRVAVARGLLALEVIDPDNET